jgi:hypothetical protein
LIVLSTVDEDKKVYATWTGAGWAEEDAPVNTTSGAKAMAGAIAAGALAVAATQF